MLLAQARQGYVDDLVAIVAMHASAVDAAQLAEVFVCGVLELHRWGMAPRANAHAFGMFLAEVPAPIGAALPIGAVIQVPEVSVLSRPAVSAASPLPVDLPVTITAVLRCISVGSWLNPVVLRVIILREPAQSEQQGTCLINWHATNEISFLPGRHALPLASQVKAACGIGRGLVRRPLDADTRPGQRLCVAIRHQAPNFTCWLVIPGCLEAEATQTQKKQREHQGTGA